MVATKQRYFNYDIEWVLALLLILVSPAISHAQVQTPDATVKLGTEKNAERQLPPTNLVGGKLTTPSNYKISVNFDKPEYFIGENAIVHFCVQNTGDKPIAIDHGGDYRFAPRALRFKVKAVDENSMVAEDPHPHPFCEGGLSGQTTIKPGDQFEEQLAFLQYCRIQKPGKYHVSVSHDLGWVPAPDLSGRKAGKNLPTAITTVTFIMPTAAQAQTVIDSMLKPPGSHAPSWKRPIVPADFSMLGNPIYLPILLTTVHSSDDAQAGSAIDGIASIATPEATQALIKLAGDNNKAIAKEAVAALVMRIPDPAWTSEVLPTRNPFENTAIDERKLLVQRSWKPEFSPQVLAVARTLLASTDERQCARAAFILESVGSQADIKYLIPALDKALETSKTLPFEKDVYPRPRGALSELMRAAQVLVKHSGTAPEHPSSPGQNALFLTALSTNAKFRPTGWQSQLRKCLASDIPYLRELAVQSIPNAAPPDLMPKVLPLLNDNNVDVQIAACKFVQEHPQPIFREPVLLVVRTAKEEWLLNESVNAAKELGANFTILEIMASRLDEESVSEKAFQTLISSCFRSEGGWGGSGVDKAIGSKLKSVWLRWLKQNKGPLSRNHLFKFDDTAVIPNLFPPNFTHNNKLLTKPTKWCL